MNHDLSIDQALLVFGADPHGARNAADQHHQRRQLDFLRHQIWNGLRFGIRNIVVAIGDEHRWVQHPLGDGSDLGVELTYALSNQENWRHAFGQTHQGRSSELVLLSSAHCMFDINYCALLEHWLSLPPSLDGICVGLDSPDTSTQPVHAGTRDTPDQPANADGAAAECLYLLRPSAFDSRASLPWELVATGPGAMSHAGLHLRRLDMDAVDRNAIVMLSHEMDRQQLARWKCRPIAFLDRDGVINIDVPYLCRPEDCVWVDGASEAIRLLNESGYLVIVVTNQSGIGRGYYSESEFHAFMDWYRQALAQRGAHLDDVFFCPYHATEGVGGYLKDAACRKPRPGMLISAMKKWPHQKERSFLIGDRESDVEAAQAAGITGHLFEGANLLDTVRKCLTSKLGQLATSPVRYGD
ncbi:MAG: HAD-IIIA family hydrolase [Planctomycetota bacterium]